MDPGMGQCREKIKEQALLLRTSGEQSHLGVWGSLEANIILVIGLTGCAPQDVVCRGAQGWREMWEPLGIFSDSGPNGVMCPLIMTGLAKHQGVVHKRMSGPCVTGSASGRVLVPKTGVKRISWDSGAGAKMCRMVS